jgi:ribosome-binding protein aMBF1 (putative translation factor)
MNGYKVLFVKIYSLKRKGRRYSSRRITKTFEFRGGRDNELERTEKQLLKDPEFVKEYYALETEYKLAATLIHLRLTKGLTHEDLAKLLNTKQESIARLESGGSLPSLSTIKKVAEALGADLEINLRPRPIE